MASSQSTSTSLPSYQNDRAASIRTSRRDQINTISNEYVLNMAFWTFLGFLLLEAVFAIIANSQSMLEDAEAMSIDAMTYLFNLWAERIKNRPLTAKELEMPEAVREYKREMTRLYLEVVPPLVSVITLISVTIYSIKDAVDSLNQPSDVPEEAVDVSIMLWFSGANLLLDLVNVTCFARAGQAFGLGTLNNEVARTSFSSRENAEYSSIEAQSLFDERDSRSDEDSEDDHTGGRLLVNLNMCSAWIVSTSRHFIPSIVVAFSSLTPPVARLR